LAIKADLVLDKLTIQGHLLRRRLDHLYDFRLAIGPFNGREQCFFHGGALLSSSALLNCCAPQAFGPRRSDRVYAKAFSGCSQVSSTRRMSSSAALSPASCVMVGRRRRCGTFMVCLVIRSRGTSIQAASSGSRKTFIGSPPSAAVTSCSWSSLRRRITPLSDSPSFSRWRLAIGPCVAQAM